MKTKRKNLETIKHRRQYQREFMHWLAENQDQFVVRQLKPIITVRYISLHFPGMTSVLSIQIRANSVDASVTWKDRFIDTILDLEMYPVRDGRTYRCKLCDSGETFSDLASMRADHLYLPFLKWCNERLFASRWLKIVLLDRSCGDACLVNKTDGSEGNAGINLFLGLKNVNGQPIASRDDLEIFHLPLFDQQT